MFKVFRFCRVDLASWGLWSLGDRVCHAFRSKVVGGFLGFRGPGPKTQRPAFWRILGLP